jgi:WD40 repeat protein/tetratricopeptide (TPR) repeat protein
MSARSRDYDRFDQLAEEFAERYRRGEQPRLEEYVERLPEMADEIREMFPALVEVEQVEEDARDDAPPPPPAVPRLRELGDYRIVREVGRGGMGVVYEAEQISLSRRVALKVLPDHVVGDRKALQRFRREAKAAARLHHTNIVPVFEVGREGDVAYYTMQFIEGQALDQVIHELRRLRAPDQESARSDQPGSTSPARPAAGIPTASVTAAGSRSRMLEHVAQSLLTGRLGARALESPPSTTRASTEAIGTDSPEPAASTAAEERNLGWHLAEVPQVTSASSSAVLPGGTAISSVESSGSRQPFFRSVAQIGRQTAQGLAYAHSRGIVHRDIKPSNLLLDPAGVVWITDFGLAKAEEDGLTATGDIMGTFRYMAPERFRGQADARADIYALGVTLYELLTLKSAYSSNDRLKLIELVKNQEPVRPRVLDSRIPRDLETIVLKAIDKDPKARYHSAEAMADDLRRFLDDEPIQARQISAAERYWRWARRNPLIATLGGVLTAVLFAMTAGSMMAATYFRTLAGREFRANQQSQVAQQIAIEARQQALEERDRSQRHSAGLALDKGIALAEQGEAARGLHWLLESLTGAPSEPAEIQRVIRINLSAWSEQVHGLRHIIRVPSRSESTAAYRCAFSPDGHLFAVASADRIEFWDAKSFEPAGKSLVFERLPQAFAFSPDAKTLITGDDQGGAQRWDVTTRSRVGPPLPHGGIVWGVAFSPDGTAILTGCGDGTVRIWDARTGQPLCAPLETGLRVSSVAFGPDGKSIMVGTGTDGRPGAAYLWDRATRAKPTIPLTHQDAVLAVAFNPAGTTVLTGSQDGTAQLWDTDTNRSIGAPLWHRHGVYGALFTPDGAAILTGCRDDLSAFLWEAATGQRIGTPLWHEGPLDCLAVSPDGRTVLSGGVDETARLWEIGRNRSRPLDPTRRMKRSEEPGPQDELRLPDYYLKKTIAYSPDRKTVLTSDGGHVARLWETSTGRPLGAPLHHARNVRTVAFSPDGKRVATASHDFGVGLLDGNWGVIHLWDSTTGRPLAPAIWQNQWVSALAFSPDGRVLASGDYGQTVQFWDVVTGQPAGLPIEQRGVVFSVAFSPDGKTLAVGTVDPAKEARLWDLATGRPKGSAMPHKDWVVEVAFSPDGRLLLTRSHDATARLWDAGTGEPLTDFLRHSGLPATAFSPDGLRLATAGNLEDQVRIWDAQTGQPLVGATLSQGSQVTALAFSPDGAVLGVGCRDGSARLWNVATARPLGPPMVQRSRIVAVTFTHDGSGLLTTTADGSTRSWPVPSPMGGDPDRIALRLQVLTGMRMAAGHDVEKLTAEAWDDRCHRLTSLEGSVAGAYASSLSESTYHEARARDAEQDGNTFAARWHLDRLISARAPAENTDSPPDLWVLHARRARAWSIAGRLDRAAADYSRAEQLGSRRLILDWYRHRVADCERAAQWQTALWYLDRCMAAEPRNWELHVSRARVLGRLGKSEERLAALNRAAELGDDAEMLVALADEYAAQGHFARAVPLYAKARQRGSLPLSAWRRNALVCLEQGDRAGYRAVCHALLDGHPKVEAPWEAETIAKICSLGPAATDELERAVALARYAAKRAAPFERDSAEGTLGAILYRAGRTQDALVHGNAAVAERRRWSAKRELWFLGMSHHRLGHDVDARRCLMEASRPIVTSVDQERHSFWSDRLEDQILRSEAEAVILYDPIFPADPFAPDRDPGPGAH